MKKTIAKTAALAMAVMLAGTAITPLYASALPKITVAVSEESEASMQEALTKVKQRITVPEELTEFSYETNKSYGTKSFTFTWKTPSGSEKYRRLEVSIAGDIITSYDMYDESLYDTYNPSFAKLSENKILEKAKAYFKQLDPTVNGDIRYQIIRMELSGKKAGVELQRYENGVCVNGNRGEIIIDKDTGELIEMRLAWFDNAEFKDPAGTKTQSEIKEIYRGLCKLTPYYMISTDREKQKKTARIVYKPDSTKEIDAFTGKYSSIWEDMEAADGREINYYDTYMMSEYGADDTAAGAGLDGGVQFTEAELKKIQQDNNLITVEKAFEMLKNDRFAAVTDDYEVESYNISSDKNFYDKETFILRITLKVKSTANNFKGYKNVYVNFNAETGEILYLNKNSYSGGGRPKLNEAAAKKTADSVANIYAKSIIGEYKYSSSDSYESYTSGSERYAISKSFTYNRYVNGIQVTGDCIRITVDSDGIVSGYSVQYTDDVKFPSADGILTPDEAFDKLYQQLDFDYYYNGWIAKDGKVNTYLLYKIDDFTLNAKTGRLCSEWGEPLENNKLPSEVKYSDIKGIPQEKAILEMKKYGVILTDENKFEPEKIVTEEEFADFIKIALNEYIRLYSDGGEREDKANDALTRETAAVIFTKLYDSDDISKLKGIFRTPYSDVKSSDENVGAIAIAYAKGFFGKGDGKFNGSVKITRAEAVQLVYDYIEKLSKNK